MGAAADPSSKFAVTNTFLSPVCFVVAQLSRVYHFLLLCTKRTGRKRAIQATRTAWLGACVQVAWLAARVHTWPCLPRVCTHGLACCVCMHGLAWRVCTGGLACRACVHTAWLAARVCMAVCGCAVLFAHTFVRCFAEEAYCISCHACMLLLLWSGVTKAQVAGLSQVCGSLFHYDL
jgi:hypothetical protein